MKKAYAYHYDIKKKTPIFYEEKGKELVLSFTAPGDLFHRVKDEVKGCAGSRWDPGSKCWVVTHPAYSQRNANVLGYLTNGTIPGTNKTRLKSWLKKPDKERVEQIKEELMQICPKLYPFQAEDTATTLFDGCGVHDHDMGLGKSIQALTAMQWMKNRLDPNSELIDQELFWIIGSKGAVLAWPSQLREWSDYINVQPSIIMNSVQGIEKAMDRAVVPPKFLVVDESARFKSPKARRSQAVVELARLMYRAWGDTRVILELSGTVQTKNPTDLHNQVEIIAPGFIREKSPEQLAMRLAFMSKKQGAHGQYSSVDAWNLDEVEKFGKRVSRLVRTRKKKDVASDLPDKIYIQRKMPVEPRVLATVAKVISELPGAQGLGAARQISDGFMYVKGYVEDEEGYFRKKRVGLDEIPTPKDDQLKADLEDLDDNGHTRVVIWACFQATLHKIVDICKDQGWASILLGGGKAAPHATAVGDFLPDATQVQDQFQLRDLDKKLAIIANPDAAGEGLTLTKASTAIYYSNTFNGGNRRQSEDRIHRLGMGTEPPNIIDYIYLPTDQYVLANLKLKKNLSDITRGELLSVMDRIKVEAV